MVMSTFDQLLVIGGLLSLLHSGYSAAQYRVYLRLAEVQFSGLLPMDIVLQSLFALGAVCAGLVRSAAPFRPIRVTDDLRTNTWDTCGFRPAFATFAHRSRAFNPGHSDYLEDKE